MNERETAALLQTAQAWRAGGRRVAVATVIKTWGAAPRPVGARLIAADDGAFAGSVSGGCVEGAVMEAAAEVMTAGAARLLRFGVADETAWEVGLSCGGEMEIHVAPFIGFRAERADELTRAIRARTPRVLLTEIPDGTQCLLSPEDPVGRGGGGAFRAGMQSPPDNADVVGRGLNPRPGLSASGQIAPGGGGGGAFRAGIQSPPDNEAPPDNGGPSDNEAPPDNEGPPGKAAEAALGLLRDGEEARMLTIDGRQFFAEPFPPPRRLILIGGGHISQELIPLARAADFEPVVVDPRRAWASAARFPEATVVNEWPDEALAALGLDDGTALAALTHDPKLDDPALACALRAAVPPRYVGALGGARSNAKRRARLQEEAGLTEAELSRIRAPIGLDIGARTAFEIALAIMAEVVAAFRRPASATTSSTSSLSSTEAASTSSTESTTEAG